MPELLLLNVLLAVALTGAAAERKPPAEPNSPPRSKRSSRGSRP